ncbi:MAG: amidase [Pirellulaceae bacterium]
MKEVAGNVNETRPSKERFGRRFFLEAIAATGVGSLVFQRALAQEAESQDGLTVEMIQNAEWVSGVELDEDERESIVRSLDRYLRRSKQLRSLPVDADTVPAFVFRPDFFYAQVDRAEAKQNKEPAGPVSRTRPTIVPTRSAASQPIVSPPSEQNLAFSSIETQATLLEQGHVSSVELTKLYLARLKKYDPVLKCVITMLEDNALEQAAASDTRRSNKATLGLLDGIPWVAKDLIALPPWKTTWGAEPFKDQIREETATVAERLADAGCVLLAKVTLGAMAWGDKWFGGMTRNPWNPDQGSSGSSAGSASAVAAGLASFALGSETLGSIVSPTTRCRTSGLRPTFGRVSRAGCMPLAWSMDKIGPIARYATDLANIFPALLGTDGRDPTLVERDFVWPEPQSMKGLRIGVTGDRLNDIESQALEYLEAEGATLVDIDLESDIPVNAMSFILGVEASTVFDDAFRENPRADYGNWPKTFRETQFMPAIDYVRANRLRSQLISETEAKFRKVDVILGGNDLLLTNLSGHPSVVVACGTEERDDSKMPGVVKLTAAAYQESTLLHVATRIQQAFPPEPSQPDIETWQAQKAAEAEAKAEADASEGTSEDSPNGKQAPAG